MKCGGGAGGKEGPHSFAEVQRRILWCVLGAEEGRPAIDKALERRKVEGGGNQIKSMAHRDTQFASVGEVPGSGQERAVTPRTPLRIAH